MECPPGGRCGSGTDTVAARRATLGGCSERGGDFYLAIRGDIDLATYGDFLMAMDKARAIRSFYQEPDRAAYRVKHQGAPLVVRWFPPQRPLERVAGDADVLRAVRHLDVEQLVETVDGRLFTECRGRGMIVTQFIEGASSPCDMDSLRRVAATLAATGQVEVAVASRVGRRAGSLPAEDLAAARQWLDEIAGDVPRYVRDTFSRLRQDVEETSDCETATSGLVHPDCHVANVIRSPRGPVLFDWEGAGVGPMVAALGWLLFSSSVAGPEHASDSADATAVEAVIAGYQSVRRLGADEMEVLSDAVRFRPLVIACRQLRHAVRTGDSTSASGWWSRYPEAKDVVKFASVV